MVHQLCPACESPISVSGGALIVVGLLWMLLWGMILSADAGLIGVVGGIGFIVAGVVSRSTADPAKDQMRTRRCTEMAAPPRSLAIRESRRGRHR
jgi:hypothetical protein